MRSSLRRKEDGNLKKTGEGIKYFHYFRSLKGKERGPDLERRWLESVKGKSYLATYAADDTRYEAWRNPFVSR